jgi:hypothetical protein
MEIDRQKTEEWKERRATSMLSASLMLGYRKFHFMSTKVIGPKSSCAISAKNHVRRSLSSIQTSIKVIEIFLQRSLLR